MKYRLEIPMNNSSRATKNGKSVKLIGNCTRTYSLVTNREGARITGFSTDKTGDTEREKFEKELSLSDGALKPYSTYWDNFIIRVPSSGVTLDDSNTLDRLKVKILQSDPGVAKSTIDFDANPNKYLFILRSEKVEASSKNIKREVQGKAYKLYMGMSTNDKKNALLIYGKSPYIVDNMEPDIIDSELGDEMDNNFKRFIEIVSDNKFSLKSKIIKYINANVIVRGSSKQTYEQDLYFNSESIGNGLDEAAVFISDSKNAKIATAMETQYKLVNKQ